MLSLKVADKVDGSQLVDMPLGFITKLKGAQKRLNTILKKIHLLCDLSKLNIVELNNQQDILLRVSEGDEKAFFILYKYYHALLKPVVFKYWNSGINAEPEEILQRTFVKVWLAREKLTEIDNFYGWIYRVAYREYLMAVRQSLNYEEHVNKYASSLATGSSNILPSDERNLQEMKDCVQDVISNLSHCQNSTSPIGKISGKCFSSHHHQLI